MISRFISDVRLAKASRLFALFYGGFQEEVGCGQLRRRETAYSSRACGVATTVDDALSVLPPCSYDYELDEPVVIVINNEEKNGFQGV